MSTAIPTQAIPGPKPGLIGGNILEFRGNQLQYLLNLARTYGDVVRFHLLKYEIFFVNHPDDVQDIMVRQAHKLNKSVIYKELLSKYLGNGLLVSDGEFWKRQRKLAQPAFHTKRISSYADTMVEYGVQMAETWQDGETRDIAEEMMRLTLFIVAKTLFDADVRDDSQKVGEALEIILHSVMDDSNALIHLPEWIPTPQRRRKQHAIDLLNEVIMGIIEERRATHADKGDLLSMLLLARDEDGQGMTDQQVRDEAVTLFLAGHETTANALTWTWYLLWQHPEIEAKLHAEVDDVLAGRAPTLEDIPNLRYTEQVIKESMRLYPPAWGFSRQIMEELHLKDGTTLPHNRTVMIAPYVIHRDPRWYPDPERFDPDRFSPENEAKLPKYAYLPFGAGPRICIGNSFAMMEAVLLLATLAARYQLRLDAGQKVAPDPLITLRPKYGMQMQLSRRVR